MLSATVIVANSNGVTPASASPAVAAAICGGKDIEQGVTEPPALTTPANGCAIAASSWPIARRKARCGARSSPSVITREGSVLLMSGMSEGFQLVQGWQMGRARLVWKRRAPCGVGDFAEKDIAGRIHGNAMRRDESARCDASRERAEAGTYRSCGAE